MQFLIPVYQDLRIRRIVERPIVVAGLGRDGVDVEIIPKTAILCDMCADEVAITEEEVRKGRLPIGYAVCNEQYVLEVVCEECRRRSFSRFRVFENLEEAGKNAIDG